MFATGPPQGIGVFRDTCTAWRYGASRVAGGAGKASHVPTTKAFDNAKRSGFSRTDEEKDLVNMTDLNPPRPTVMLVGTGHWSNPGKDYRSTEFDDMLAPRRQAEIETCLEQLARFAPTTIALESMADPADSVNQDYRRYRAGALALTANERHQIGFRLAARMDHERVYGIDWHDLERDFGWDEAVSAAERLGQHDLVTAFLPGPDHAIDDESGVRSCAQRCTVSQQLLRSSDPAILEDSHCVYMDLARVGQGDDYIGADVVLRWYERNMKIFVNLTRIVSGPDDRILVLIGGGHLPLLSHFLKSSRAFDLVPVSDWLS